MPFLASSLKDDTIWKVTVPSTSITLDRTEPVVDKNIIDPKNPLLKRTQRTTKQMSWVCHLSAKSGKLVKCVGTASENMDDIWPPATAQDAEKQMLEAGGEKWLEFASTDAQHNIPEVLSTVQTSFGGVDQCREVIVYCISWQMNDARLEDVKEKQVAWSIECRGLPATGESHGSYRGHVAKLEKNLTNHLRHIVLDADLRWITATTTPQPQQPVKKDANGESVNTSKTTQIK